MPTPAVSEDLFGGTATFAPQAGPKMPALTINHGNGSEDGGAGVSRMLENFLKTLQRAPTGVVIVEAHAFGAGGHDHGGTRGEHQQ